MNRPAFSLYDASAGSGKTYALVREYLKIILTATSDDAYRNILAITFTNKAVHEMKSRIVSSLSEFAKDHPSEKAQSLLADISCEVNIPETALKEKAKQIIRHIIHNYAAFDISTIDKFTHRVIRAFAHDLNLPVTFEVSLDTENLLTEAVDALIARAGDDQTLTDLLVDFTMEKTDDDKSWDISREIIETGKLILNENHRHEIAHLKGKSIPEFRQAKTHLQQQVKAIDEENKSVAKMLLQTLDERGIDPASFSYGTFPKHLREIAATGCAEKRYASPEEVAVKQTAHDGDIIRGLLPDMVSALSKVYENLQRRGFYSAFLKNITPLSLLNTVDDQLAQIQQEQHILSISEFNKLVHEQIQGQPAPFIYERLGERYRHFFIDEFQDTSEMQWENLIPLIDNATSSEDLLGERGSLMIVGDPKQSIYRWRGGKAEQFIALSKGHNPFNNKEKRDVTLDTNYRSYSEIINFNNAFFRFLSRRFDNMDYRDLYENRSAQKCNAKTGGYVEISFADVGPEDDDKSLIFPRAALDAIGRALDKGFQYHDIAVLTRKRDHGIAIAHFLTEAGVPIISSETLLLDNSEEVRFLINVLRYLKSPEDLEAKARMLYFIAGAALLDMPVHDFIAEGMMHQDEAPFAVWLESFGLGFPFGDTRKQSLFEAVSAIIRRYLPKSGGNAYVQFFLDLVWEREIKTQPGLPDFLEFWDENAHRFSIPSPEDANAVRILTIHKSKGLEFPVVIFPYADEQYSRKPKDKLWLDADMDAFGLPRVLVDQSRAIEGFGENAAATFREKQQEELLDNVNVLYVALTRAQEQLYVISAMHLRKDGLPPVNSLPEFLISFLDETSGFDSEKNVYSFGGPEKLSPPSDPPEALLKVPFLSDVLDPEDIRIARRESLMWGTKQQEAIEYGNTVHEIMANVGNASDVGQALREAVDNGLIAAVQIDDIRQTVISIVQHEALAEHFEAGNEVLSERTILQQGDTLRPDRVAIRGGRAFLLDYKTGAHKESYIDQVNRYADALENLGFDVAHKALVYIGQEVNVVSL
jgi:ATP-dependent exoDNAse (exonuclease V) beta subunit